MLQRSQDRILIITLFTLIVAGLANAYELGLSPLDTQVLSNSTSFITSFAFWAVEIYVSFGIFLCLFYIEVSDNIGQSTLLNFFMGKYHQPKEEDRIFMFLDMKSSTTIAEKLGHQKYFNMLKEYYSDLTDSIIKYGGEIYQYVGDEVVITWKSDMDNSNVKCIECFFDMKSTLKEKENQYKLKFGVAPTFKAGVHLGRVTTGEIGIIKKEIIFSGDVLNSAARIQSLCNKFETDLLSSDYFIKLFTQDLFDVEIKGKTELRGRKKKITLYTIKEK